MGNVNLEEDSSKLVSYIDPYWFVAVNEIVFVPPWIINPPSKLPMQMYQAEELLKLYCTPDAVSAQLSIR